MQGSVNDACEEPLRPRRGVWENRASYGCPPLQESDLDFALPSAMKGLRRLMLPVATGGNVCCTLKCSSDGWMRPPVRCPDWRAVVYVLLSKFSDFIPVVRQLTTECRLCSISASCRCNGGGHTHIQGRTASGDCSGGEKISRPGLRCGESSRFRGNARVCQFHAADNSVNTCVVPPRGFGGAASFSVFQLWAQVGATQWALPTTLPEPVAKSLLDVGDVVTRRQDTSRTRVQVVGTFVGDLRLAQVLDSCHLLPGSLGGSAIFRRLSRVRSVSRESCAWSCGATELALPGR